MDSRDDRRPRSSWPKRTLFSKKKESDEWHQQVDFTAGILRPSDKQFPWLFLKKHTDYYLKKKGKITQQDTDIRLAILIESHEARDIAIAACAHAMSPASVRALLNIELNVAPAAFYGLQMFLQSLIAANYCNPKSITDLEAQWAYRLLPYAIHGSGAAGKFLEGVCVMLNTSSVPNMNLLPNFSILARRAFKDFALQLEALTLKCSWVTARSSVAWFSTLAQNIPAVTPPGHLLAVHLLDTQFPVWRIWSMWRPNLDRITLLNGLDNVKRGVLPDMLALEGPDFIAGKHATLRDGLISQYGAAKPLVRFRGLLIEVTTRNKDELKDMLNRVAISMETALTRGGGAFKLFVQLTITRPITQEALQVIEAVSRIPDTPKFHVHNAVLEVYLEQHRIGGRHIFSLQHVICALDDIHGEDLRKVLLRSWLIQGIENCIRECQAAVRTHIETGMAWTHLALEFHTFCAIVKGSRYCLSLLNATLKAQLDVLPPAKVLRDVAEVYTAAGGVKIIDMHENSLKSSIESFCIDRLMEKGTIRHASQRTVDAILQVWNETSASDPRRNLAIVASNTTSTDFILRCRCLRQITELSDEFVRDVLAIVDEARTEAEKSCVKFIRLLANTNNVDVVQCWKGILYNMLNEQSATILDYTLQHFKAWEWSQWMLDLNTVFADTIMNPKASPPLILQLHFHLWVQQLSEYIPTITRLEDYLGDNTSAIQCILRGGDTLWGECLVHILNDLTKAQEQPVERLMQTITGRLSKKGTNAGGVSECVRALLGTSEDGADACQQILDSSQDKKIPSAVTEVLVAGWIQDEDAIASDKAAIRALALLLGLETYEDIVPSDKLLLAANYYEALETEVFQEADRLEGIQRALKARDPLGTAILLQQLGIQDISPLDEELESLPVDVIDAVEKRGQNEVEISFPLTSFTDLQRSATGIGTAGTLLVRLFLDYMGEMPTAFCVHLDSDPDLAEFTTEHSPWLCLEGSKEPEGAYCRGKLTPLTWQLNRILYRHLRKNGVGVADIYHFVKKRLEDLAHCCIVCGQTHNARHVQLRRSMPCQASSCTNLWSNVPLEVRIPEIHSDPFAVDMLLTGVYAAALSGRSELLPGCPITNTQSVTRVLNSLPSLSDMASSHNLSATLQSCHHDAEKMLTWACTHYRGFVASASGICRIPGLPDGTHQFILANANPILESGFASKLPRHNPQTRVLFHGTSLDRLSSILSQGLRVYSGTSLQRTGAAHGKGIYMAEEPATSFSYSASAVSWRSSGLHNMRLLLGCEVVGNGFPVSSGIHVIKDEKTVMVRYVFMFTNSAYAPNANQIGPAMLSAMNALRSGAV